MKTKNELLETLRADKNIGLAYGQSGVMLRVMYFREFLDWYSDAGNTDMYITDEQSRYDEETESDITIYTLVTRSRADKRKIHYKETFDTEEQAQDAYYTVLERSYNDDNGAGGIFYANESAIEDLESGKYDEYFQAEEVDAE